MRRHRLSKLVALGLVGAAALTLASPSWAYLSPSPPPGFGGNPGSWTFKPPSGTSQLNGIMKGPGPSVNLGGAGTITRPVGFKLAEGASRALGRALFFNPALAVGVGLAAWLAEECIERKNGKWMMTCGGEEQSPTHQWAVSSLPDYQQTWYGSAQAACEASKPFWQAQNSDGNFTRVVQSTQPVGTFPQSQCAIKYVTYYQGTAGAVQDGGHSISVRLFVGDPQEPVEEELETAEEMEEILAPKTLPEVLPAIDYPVEFPPIWNPSPTPTDPATAPKTMPVIVPVGDPVKVPNTDPAQWKQPAIELRHSPTTSQPWRMDNKPVEVPVTGPNGGLPGATDVPPVGEETPDPNAPAQTPGLCDSYPDILACQKMGMIEAEEVKNTEVPLEITPADGFASGGTCPQPKQVSIQGKSFSFTMQPICDMAVMVKPLFLGFAWLTAAMIFLGIARKEG